MTDTTKNIMERVVDLLKVGYLATYEYPGFVLITAKDGSEYATGTANPTWTIDRTKDGVALDGWDTGIASTSDDAETIVRAVAKALADRWNVQAWDVPLWAAEHGADYDVPRVIWQHPLLTDTSWHNDVCPSFVVNGYDKTPSYDDDVRLWVNLPNPKDREEGPECRFQVSDANGDILFEDDNDYDGAIACLLKCCPVKTPAPTPEQLRDVISRALSVIEELEQADEHSELVASLRAVLARLEGVK